MVAQSKKYKLNSERSSSLPETIDFESAIKHLKSDEVSYGFDETIEISMNLGIDPRHADQAVRGVVLLPKGNGKKVTVAVFAKSDKAKEALDAGADIVGDEDLVLKAKSGDFNFDKVVSTPDMMAQVGTLGKILGPKGLMPNPKLGTVTFDVAKAVSDLKAGQVEFRADKGGVIHAGIGKKSFSEDDLLENLRAFVGAILSAKPTGVRGAYVNKVSICTTMSPSLNIDITNLYEFVKVANQT